MQIVQQHHRIALGCVRGQVARREFQPIPFSGGHYHLRAIKSLPFQSHQLTLGVHKPVYRDADAQGTMSGHWIRGRMRGLPFRHVQLVQQPLVRQHDGAQCRKGSAVGELAGVAIEICSMQASASGIHGCKSAIAAPRRLFLSRLRTGWFIEPLTHLGRQGVGLQPLAPRQHRRCFRQGLAAAWR